MAKQQREIRRGDGYVTVRLTSEGETRYQARWREGIKWRSQTFDSREMAEDHLRAIGRAKRAGTHRSTDRLTVQSAVEAHLERGKRRWNSNTYASYKQVARKRIYPYLGQRDIHQLTTIEVQEWLNDLSDADYLPSSVSNARIILMGMYKELIRLKVATENPVIGTSVPRRQPTNVVIWTPAEIRAVLDAAKEDVQMYAFYVLALTTGMRQGELRGLRWGDIDFAAASVHCNQSVSRDENMREIIGKTTKTKSGRYIALTDTAVNALKAARQDQTKRRLAARYWSEHDFIFDRGDGHFIPKESIYAKHRLIVAQARVRYARLHDLRHTVGTTLTRHGINVKLTGALLGHKDARTTANTYSHADLDMQRDLIALLEHQISDDFTHVRESMREIEPDIDETG